MKCLWVGLVVFSVFCWGNVFAESLRLEDYFSVEEIARASTYYEQYDRITLLARVLTYFFLFLIFLTSIHFRLDQKWDFFYDKTFARIGWLKRLRLNFGLLPRLFFKVVCWIFFFEVLWTVCNLPIQYLSHGLQYAYGMTTRTFGQYYLDSWNLYWFILTKQVLIAILFLTLYKMSSRWWWLSFALLHITISFASNYFSQSGVKENEGIIQQKSLEEGVLRTKLEKAIASSGVSIADIKYTDESKRTKAPNAWILSSANENFLFFTDTCFQYSDEELITLSLHEIGHIYYGHPEVRRWVSWSMVFIYWLLLYLFFHFYLRLRYRDRTVIEKNGVALVYVLCFCFLGKIVGLVMSPPYCLLTQHQEIEAERYAIEHSGDPDSMIHIRKAMTVENLSRLEGSRWEQLWYGHPFVLDFFQVAEEMKKELKPVKAK